MVSGVNKMMLKIVSVKFTPMSIFIGQFESQCRDTRKCFLHHQVVSGVKINDGKICHFKGYFNKYMYRFLSGFNAVILNNMHFKASLSVT